MRIRRHSYLRTELDNDCSWKCRRLTPIVGVIRAEIELSIALRERILATATTATTYILTVNLVGAKQEQILLVTCAAPVHFFSTAQSYCSRLSVGLLSYDSRLTLIRRDHRKKCGRAIGMKRANGNKQLFSLATSYIVAEINFIMC